MSLSLSLSLSLRTTAQLVPAPSSLLTGLVAWFELDEFSDGSGPVSRYDSVSGLELTDDDHASSVDDAVLCVNKTLSAENSIFAVGDIDFTFSAWVYCIGTGGYKLAASSWEYPSNNAFAIGFGGDTSHWGVRVSSTGSNQLELSSIEATVLNTWVLLTMWHDSTGNTLNLQVNDNTPASTSTSAGVFTNSGKFWIGGRNSDGDLWNGRVKKVGLWKNKILSSEEIAALYGEGTPPAYPFEGILPTE